MKIHTYYDHALRYPLAVRVEASGVLEADDLIRQAGFNPLKLALCVGIRITLSDLSQVQVRRFTALPAGNKARPSVHYPKDYETLYVSGEVYATPWCDNKAEALKSLLASGKQKTTKHDVVNYEYAGAAHCRQSDTIRDFKRELVIQNVV
jgi:hypothetical protein